MTKKNIKVILLIVGCFLLIFLIRALIMSGIIYFIFTSSKIEVNDDISKYNDYMFSSAKEEYRDKWGMDEDIFPKQITNNMNVIDYKMVYYDPWDKQFLSYLIVKYNDIDFKNEIERLQNYNSTPYLGYYGVKGFSKYDLVSIYADSYNGFVYAITDNKNTIIYVELIFCNYYYDIDYKKYINNDYLPDGFDALQGNKYLKKMLKENN